MSIIPNPRILRLLFWIILPLGLAACGSIIDTGQDKVADNIFDLEPLSVSGGNGDKVALFLEPPTYPAYLGTFKIAVKPGGQEIQYLSGARWSDQAPALVMRFLMVSLENSGQFLVNTSQNTALPKDYEIALDIRDFSTHIGPGNQPNAIVELDTTLINAESLEVLDTRTFSANVPAGENSKVAIAAAFQNAMEEIARDMTTWLQGQE